MSVQLHRRLFTVEEYYRMAEAGIPSADERVELIIPSAWTRTQSLSLISLCCDPELTFRADFIRMYG